MSLLFIFLQSALEFYEFLQHFFLLVNAEFALLGLLEPSLPEGLSPAAVELAPSYAAHHRQGDRHEDDGMGESIGGDEAKVVFLSFLDFLLDLILDAPLLLEFPHLLLQLSDANEHKLIELGEGVILR